MFGPTAIAVNRRQLHVATVLRWKSQFPYLYLSHVSDHPVALSNLVAPLIKNTCGFKCDDYCLPNFCQEIVLPHKGRSPFEDSFGRMKSISHWSRLADQCIESKTLPPSVLVLTNWPLSQILGLIACTSSVFTLNHYHNVSRRCRQQAFEVQQVLYQTAILHDYKLSGVINQAENLSGHNHQLLFGGITILSIGWLHNWRSFSALNLSEPGTRCRLPSGSSLHCQCWLFSHR